jgi:enediyne biosynthesis protein E4
MLLLFGHAFGLIPHSEASEFDATPLVDLSAPSGNKTLFEQVSAAKSGVSYRMQLPGISLRFRELLQLAALGGVTTGDFDHDGWTDFFVASPLGGSKLFRNLGDFKFQDVTDSTGLGQAGFWATGAHFADIDNDGRLDLYVCGYRMPNRLYLNQGKDPNGITQFSEKAQEFGLDFNGGSMQMYFADMDRDGDLDGYLATTAVPPPPGVKFQVRFEGKKPVVPEELQEYWGLIYLPGEKAHPSENGQYDHLFRNDGSRFTEITDLAGIHGPHLTLGAIWWDFNQDGWPDLYVANDYLGPDMLYLNQKDGTFKDVILQSMPHTPWSSMGVDVGDINNDGMFDLIACDMMGTTHYRRQVMLGESGSKSWFLDFAKPRQYSRNAVYLNTGTDRFMEVAYMTGMAASDWTWAPRIEDFDLDGRVDVLFTNGMLRDVQHSDLANYADRTHRGGSPEWAKFWSEQSVRKEANMAFQNKGDLQFENVSDAWGLNHPGVSFGVATADFDQDGDLDLVINNADGPLHLLRNLSANGNRLTVRLKGTRSNHDGIGATVHLKAGGVLQSRQVITGRAWLSSSEPLVHFGLGTALGVDELKVRWPSGVIQRLENISINQRLVIHEPLTQGENQKIEPLDKSQKPWFRPDTSLNTIQHQTQDFDDFALQALLPIGPSKTKLAVAWADADSDSDMDCFMGGGLGYAGSLYLQQSDGAFIAVALPSDMGSINCFDSDAHFLDVDKDQDLDLLVTRWTPLPNSNTDVSGMVLYLNDGAGRFSQSPPETLPAVLPFINCMAVEDVTGDGNLDIYLGGGSVPGKYPLGSPGYLFIREGERWMDQTPEVLKRQPWIVEDALWSDVDTDGQKELLLATQYGSVKLLRRQNEVWFDQTKEAGLDERKGWWNAIAAADLDGDGDEDFVLGNRGSNTPSQATSSHPDWLIYGDMDANGRPELVEAYTENNVLYPRRGFDALSRSMPFLRQKFINFHQFSTSGIASMFSKEAIQKAYHLQINTIESGVLLNQGNFSFMFTPLPRMVQTAPINDIALGDINQDGMVDMIVAQNDFSPQSMHGRMDGGVSMLLQGKGDGFFEPVPSRHSGITVAGEARSISITDINGDGKPDIVFGSPGESLKTFMHQ